MTATVAFALLMLRRQPHLLNDYLFRVGYDAAMRGMRPATAAPASSREGSSPPPPQ